MTGASQDGSPAASHAANRLGILAMVASQAAFVCGDTFAKLASDYMPTGELIVLRGIFATAMVLAMLTASGEMRHAREVLDRTVLMRACVEAFVIACFLSALPLLQLSNIVAITQVAPIITTFILVVLFKQSVGWRRWGAIGFGFLGVLLIVKPDARGLNPAAALVLVTAALISVRDLITRRVPAGIPSMVITFATTEVAILAGIGLGLFEAGPLEAGPFGGWRMPPPHAFLYLAAAAAATTIGNFCVVSAFRSADPSVVSPFRYCIVVFALAMGFAVWRDVPDALSVLGTLAIVASGIFIIWRERVRGVVQAPAP